MPSRLEFAGYSAPWSPYGVHGADRPAYSGTQTRGPPFLSRLQGIPLYGPPYGTLSADSPAIGFGAGAVRSVQRMLEGFLGWHVVIIAAVIAIPVGLVAIAVALIRGAGRR